MNPSLAPTVYLGIAAGCAALFTAILRKQDTRSTDQATPISPSKERRENPDEYREDGDNGNGQNGDGSNEWSLRRRREDWRRSLEEKNLRARGALQNEARGKTVWDRNWDM